MAFDEFLYGRISRYFRLKKLNEQTRSDRIIYLDRIHIRLALIAKAVSGNPVEILPAEREGGYKNNVFFLPAKCDLFDDKEINLAFYYFRVLYLSVQQHLQVNLHTFTDAVVTDERQIALKSSENILPALFSEYPVCETMHSDFLRILTAKADRENVIDTSWLYGRLMRNEEENTDKNLLQNLPDKIRSATTVKPQTIIKSKAVEEIKTITVDKKAQEDYVLTHNFEKVDTADEFNGTWRDFDGEDELESHKDALDELNLKFTIRVDDMVHSVYQSDFLENTNVSESASDNEESESILYDEWDYKKKKYKSGFCKLYPQVVQSADEAYYHKTIHDYRVILNGLRKMLSNVNNRYQLQRRQPQGNELDIDSVTDFFTDIISGHTPSENIYLSNRKKEKEISILLLLDTSLSSDGYVDGNRVIDIEKQISILFGEILHEFRIDFCISAFHSNTRNHSSFQVLKGFEKNWEKARNNIGAIEPAGFTRIGTAIRHAGKLLEERSSKSKWLILLSDGKPNDYDRYEGKYGIEDIKQSLRELNAVNINSYALAIEAVAKYYLPQMFGQNHYQILSSTEELLTSLVKLYERIKELK
ncbi:MAG: VWA domain-containing protein [Bacteroidetes bacterium]|nr:VWA domain-containing protein [Bacteroidota bacterium]